MRITQARSRTSRGRAGRARRPAGTAAAVASVACLLLVGAGVTAGVPAAQAAKGAGHTTDQGPGSGQDAYPTQEQVRAAQADARDAASRVASIQASLALANQQLEAAAMAAEQASEVYNGARWRVEQATEALAAARKDADRADRQVAAQRDQLATLVASSYQDGGDVTAVNAVLGADGPEALMGQMLAYEGASSSAEADIQQFSATATLAEVFRAQAVTAQAEQERLLAEATDARAAAASAADAAQQAASSIAAQKSALVGQLAALEGISVQLAQERQTALEEIERERAAQEAADRAAAQAAAEAAAEAAAAAAAEPDPPADSGSTPAPTAPVTPPPATPPASPPPVTPPPVAPPVVAPPPPVTPPATQGGAAAAVAFARAQLGEPYVWGAAGPSSWDCSGLMMGAWQAGGVSLPHYSVAQYDATTPISVGQLQPGDLVFWGTTSSPSSIHHVAMYLGDGLIIHAPRTGRPVAIESMYYWIPPNFFGRV